MAQGEVVRSVDPKQLLCVRSAMEVFADAPTFLVLPFRGESALLLAA